ncbi:MAG: flagellar motor protein MotB [Planctomycetes bacterium]|nr:flagellar motor protein MotB [Planctomycetota bacterium]
MANGNGKEECPPAGAPDWTVTYGDMMTLLLCFFVILVAISEVKEEKFHKVMESIRQYLGYENAVAVEPGDSSAGSIHEEIRKVLNEQGSPNPEGAPARSTLGQHVLVQTIEEGYKITIGGKVLFDEGASELKPGACAPLDRLVGIIKGYPNKLEVRGHTAVEVLPVDGSCRDLFDLAYERAKATAEYLKDSGIKPRRIRLYSGGPFDRPASNLTYEGLAANRSVEIIVSEELIEPEGAGGE